MHFFFSVLLAAAALSSADFLTRVLRSEAEPFDQPSAPHADAPALTSLVTSGERR